jgi:signal transduction histidine kinase
LSLRATRLTVRWLRPARAAWLALAVALPVLYVLAAPARFAEMAQLPPEEAAALARLGLTPSHHALYHVTIEHLLALVFLAVAVFMAARRSDDWLVLLTSAYLLTFAAPAVMAPSGLLAVGLLWLRALGAAAYVLIFLFPDGRFVPRWTRWVALAWASWALLWLLVPAVDPEQWAAPGIGAGGLGLAALLPQAALALLGLGAQVYRYRRVATPAQRQQSKWVLYGLAILVLGFILAYLPESLLPVLGEPGVPHLAYRTVRKLALAGSRIALPITLAVAMLRYRLWDIDLVINRTLVYGALTAGTVGVYVLVVGELGAALQAVGAGLAPVLPVVAAALVALVFQPMRARIQRGVNRLMYGERDDPYAVLAGLGRRLEGTLAPEAVLSTIVETVAAALKLPYAAIEITGAGQQVTTVGTPRRDGATAGVVETPRRGVSTVAGPAPGELLRLPLVYQSELIGHLLAAPRTPGEPFSPADLRLLDDLARQAGPAVHSVRLTADLARSRERIVTAREEERRRLRRDLHDGLGPVLASLTLRLDAARNLLARDPVQADHLLLDLKSTSQTAVADVRRLVYGLRPPALDELGLVSALREQVNDINHDPALCLTIEAPDPLPPLPAAVEVAAYRIGLEALANVLRHAQARQATLRLSLDETHPATLRVEVTDDGRGLPAEHRAGVGLTSMRERVAELGGTFLVERRTGGGTRVLASLPVIG